MARPKAEVGSESQKRRALALLYEGLPCNEVAKLIGVNRRTLSRWRNDQRGYGWNRSSRGLKPGRPPGLSREEREGLGRLLQRGPQAAGFPSGPWKSRDLQKVVAFYFGRMLGTSSIARLMHQLGWIPRAAGLSWEKPSEGDTMKS